MTRRVNAYTASATEAEVFETIREAVKTAKGALYHTFDSRGSNPGFPDCIVWTRWGVIYAFELKTMTGRVSPEQRAWLDRFNQNSIFAAVVRPLATDDAISLQDAVDLIGGSLEPMAKGIRPRPRASPTQRRGDATAQAARGRTTRADRRAVMIRLDRGGTRRRLAAAGDRGDRTTRTAASSARTHWESR